MEFLLNSFSSMLKGIAKKYAPILTEFHEDLYLIWNFNVQNFSLRGGRRGVAIWHQRRIAFYSKMNPVWSPTAPLYDVTSEAKILYDEVNVVMEFDRKRILFLFLAPPPPPSYPIN